MCFTRGHQRACQWFQTRGWWILHPLLHPISVLFAMLQLCDLLRRQASTLKIEKNVWAVKGWKLLWERLLYPLLLSFMCTVPRSARNMVQRSGLANNLGLQAKPSNHTSTSGHDGILAYIREKARAHQSWIRSCIQKWTRSRCVLRFGMSSICGRFNRLVSW